MPFSARAFAFSGCSFFLSEMLSDGHFKSFWNPAQGFLGRKGVMVMEFCPDCGAQIIHAEGCEMCACCGWSKCSCNVCTGKEVNDGVYTRAEL